MGKGKFTAGYGTPEQRTLEIIEAVQEIFNDNRLISVLKIEDGSIVISVENPKTSGRAKHTSMWLSKESFIGVIATALEYISSQGEDLQELIKSVGKREIVHFSASFEFKVENDNTNDTHP